MKILSIGNFTRGWDGSVCDEEHIASALENLGHEVIRMQREALKDSSIPDADFTLVAQWDGYGGLSDLPRPIVYWAFDHQADNQDWHQRLIAYADLYLSKRIADSKYPNWQWLSQDFSPMFLDICDDEVEEEYEVVFTGSYLPWAKDRIEILKAVDKEYDLHIFSVTPDQWKADGLENVHGPVMDAGLKELYAKSKIVLSIDHTIEAGYWSDRNAQIMACGGLVLFKYVPLSESTFHDNIIYFYEVQDCLDKIEYLLKDDNYRDIMSFKGYEFAHQNLMVVHRVQDLLTIVENIK
jgi:hypothetical protein